MSSLADIPDVLGAPFTSYLLQTHPNTFALDPSSEIPPDISYTRVIRAYLTEDDDNTTDLQPHIANLIAAVRRVELPRNPIDIPHVDEVTKDAQKRYPRLSQGMSPKKAHEVFRMAAYILALVRANHLPTGEPRPGAQTRLHIVDVGAGQGYLTRALRALLPEARILALDADHAQSAGAIQWEERLFGKNSSNTGSSHGQAGIEHRTVLIGAEGDPEELGLRKVIDDWVQESQEGDCATEPAPVLFVALHACGSLTPALLRAFITASNSTPGEYWRPAGAVAVGCCYNLMNPIDFPLSPTLCRHTPALDLPPAAFHLAAQIPGTWVSPESRSNSGEDIKVSSATALAIRKVAWRALLERALQSARAMTEDELRKAQEHQNTATQDIASQIQNEKADTQRGLNVKKAKKQAKKEKKPSATVPARWERRPENWTSKTEGVQSVGESQPSTSPSPVKTTSVEVQIQPQPQDHSAPTSGMGATPALRRLGKLHDSAYSKDWDAFLREAAVRMGVLFGKPASSAERPVQNQDLDEDEQRRRLERQLETLHVLRCIVGPAIESAILKDRQEWVRDALHACNLEPVVDSRTEAAERRREPLKVELVNLFDQYTGSGRNVAIVIGQYIPCDPSYSS